VLFLAGGCDPAKNADKLANRFVDAYFLETDFEAAKKLSEGAARERIEHDQKAADSARGSEGLNGARSPVYYERAERRDISDQLVHFTYALEVHGELPFSRSILVMVARRGEGWSVIGFRELGDRVGESGEEPGLGVRTSTGAAPPPK
jgi:hypothetical protein